MTRATSKVRRVTVEGLPSNFGPDRNRPLVVSISTGGGQTMVSLRPLRAGKARELAITATDLYHYLLRIEANKRALEKAREKKVARARSREKARLDRMERKLRHGRL